MLANAAVSAVVNLLFLAGVPFFFYATYHKVRHKRSLSEIAARAGLQRSEPRYLAYCAAFALAAVAILVIFPPSPEPFVREGSPQRAFRGLGLSGSAIVAALLYGFVQTGFPEELLFRGIIAGSLSRRLSLPVANTGQALIFLAPHVVVLKVMPEMWGILPVVFVGALVLGWVRIKSGSIVGPWIVHGSCNVAICLIVAAHTTP